MLDICSTAYCLYPVARDVSDSDFCHIEGYTFWIEKFGLFCRTPHGREFWIKYPEGDTYRRVSQLAVCVSMMHKSAENFSHIFTYRQRERGDTFELIRFGSFKKKSDDADVEEDLCNALNLALSHFEDKLPVVFFYYNLQRLLKTFNEFCLLRDDYLFYVPEDFHIVEECLDSVAEEFGVSYESTPFRDYSRLIHVTFTK